MFRYEKQLLYYLSGYELCFSCNFLTPKVFYPKSWAQDTLFTGIRILKGELCVQSLQGAILDAITLKSQLRRAGYPKQSVTLNRWIQRASQGDLNESRRAILTRRSPSFSSAEGGLS